METLGAIGPHAGTPEVIEALQRLAKTSDVQVAPELAAAAAEALQCVRSQDSNPVK